MIQNKYMLNRIFNLARLCFTQIILWIFVLPSNLINTFVWLVPLNINWLLSAHPLHICHQFLIWKNFTHQFFLSLIIYLTCISNDMKDSIKVHSWFIFENFHFSTGDVSQKVSCVLKKPVTFYSLQFKLALLFNSKLGRFN